MEIWVLNMTEEDLFGMKCLKYYRDGDDQELILELDNDEEISNFSTSFYVDNENLRELEKEFLEYARGTVLDIGSGSGRVAKQLEEMGHDVVGVDNSSSMVEIMRDRGLEAYEIDITEELPSGEFDTAIMYGNGFGLPGTLDEIKDLLKRLKSQMCEEQQPK